ncbi:DUF5682 family protein [Gordonia sp. ABSL1-1]|uniref:DUF5682 family protein n=1 Tax=Gordonia sp. ABSL1-1 TaxID=3053923 RepID=UPI00257441CD|nr:DUF5682 family protein [Gordonia sp. ABSL1-1]MDL9936586.1 DUF5682 family protein [Gordonia sp. ABSL1-1]
MSALIDASAARATAAGLVTDDLVIVPVRHHSPACALQVRRALDLHRPAVVLVEGPRSFTPLIADLVDPRAQAPLAVYAYTDPARRGPDTPRRGAYYPFCDFSPELVALRTAAARDIPARFIDLDFGEQLRVEHIGADAPAPSLIDEHHLAMSHRLSALAQRLGCRDHDDLWEHLFEADADAVDLAEHLARMSAYCLLARADAEATPGLLDRDGTTAREAEMAWHVGQAIAEPGRDGPVLVVVGGFHAVVLADLVAAGVPRPRVPATAERCAVIRFAFDRVEKVSGYAAGIPSPAWQQRIHDGLAGPAQPSGSTDHPPRVAATLEMLLDIAADLEVLGRPVGQPTLADAFAHTLALADLRGHAAPLRTDLLDGITATFIKGDADLEGTAILAAAHRVLTGTRIGVLPPTVTAPPLVADTLDRLRRARLAVDTPIPAQVTLSIYRSAGHRRTSRLLHGLCALDIPFATPVAGPDFVGGTDLHLIGERWDYRWSPTTESALVEAARYGDTLPDAVAARFDELLSGFSVAGGAHDATIATSLLMQACRLGLHAHAHRCLTVVAQVLARDASFIGVVRACGTLELLVHAREPLEAGGLDGLGTLLRTAVERAIYLGRTLPGEPPDEVVSALSTLAEVVADPALIDDPVDVDGFWDLVTTLRTDHPDAQIRGAATGLDYSSGRLDAARTAAAVTGALSGTVEPGAAVDFLRGVLRTAREIAWQIDDLVDAIGDLLAGWAPEVFVSFLPGLRLAFAELTPAEIDRVAAVIARRLGITDPLTLAPAVPLDAATVTENLAWSARAHALLVADGLADWVVSG